MKKYIDLLCTLLILAFIWGNSLRDAPHSSVESQWVLDVLRSLFSYFPGIDHLTMHIVRKMAHLTEYMALGFFLSCTCFHCKKAIYPGTILLIGFLIASIDETLQLFSPGRSGQISDVLLDTFGVFCGLLLLYLLYVLEKWIDDKNKP